MSTINAEIVEIRREQDHSIDYGFYQNRARCFRSQAVLTWLRGLFTNKKTSFDETLARCA